MIGEITHGSPRRPKSRRIRVPRRSLAAISDVPLIPTGYERMLPPNTQMVVHSGRRAAGRRVDGRVLDLGGSDSHRTMHRRPSIEHCVVLDGPDDPALFALARSPERFDHVLAVCAFSRADDVEATLAAVSTLLEPDGRLHFVEPVSTSSRVRSASRLARPVVSAASAFHLDRNVVREIRAAGFTICDIHRDRATALRWPFQHVARGSARPSLPVRPRQEKRRR